MAVFRDRKEERNAESELGVLQDGYRRVGGERLALEGELEGFGPPRFAVEHETPGLGVRFAGFEVADHVIIGEFFEGDDVKAGGCFVAVIRHAFALPFAQEALAVGGGYRGDDAHALDAG